MKTPPPDHPFAASAPRRPLPWVAVFALAAALLVPCLRAASQQAGGSPPAAPPAPVTVTLSARGEDVRSVLKSAFQRAPGVKYRIEEGVRGVVTVSVRDVSLEAALRSIARANPEPLEIRRDGETWVVAPRRSAAASVPPAQETTGDPERVTLDVRDARLADVLATLFDRAPKGTDRAGARYQIADAVSREASVTVRIDGLPLGEALDRIAAAAQPRLSWRRSPERVYEFRVAGGEAGPEPVRAAAAPQVRVSVDVRDADVRTVLADLFRQAKVVNYTIANDVVGYLTLKMLDRPLEDALALVCRTAVPPLRYRKTPEGVYEVRARSFGNAAAASPAPDADPGVGGAAVAAASSPWEAIPLMYAEADVLTGAANLLRPDGITRVIGYLPTNTLIVRGGDPARDGFLTLVLGYGSRGGGGAAAGAGGTAGGGGATPGGSPAGSGGGGSAPTNPGAGTGGGTTNP